MRSSYIIITFLSFLLISCKDSKVNSFESIPSKEFASKIKSEEKPQLLDVRTPEEFSSEHIDQAVNINWNSEDFTSKVESYDKSKPVFVYCLSGGRSKKAAEKLTELGFTKVYDLDGGIMKYEENNLITAENLKDEISSEDFNKLLNSNKKVFIDFYAEWCAPCKQMEPYILKMQKEQTNKITIIRIDVDKNKNLATQLKIDQLPTLILYENQKEKWKNIGFISEQDLKKQLQ